MKFKIDENLPVDLVADLHQAGHDADTVLDENLAGAADPVVVAAALREGRILLTLDKGIASLIQPTREHPCGSGLVPSRCVRPLGGIGFIRSHLAELLVRELANGVTVVSGGRIRVR